MIGEYFIASGAFQGVELHIESLVRGGDPGIADEP